MSKEDKLKYNVGLKSCDKCEYYLRCEECVGSHYREEIPKLNQRIAELEEQLKNARKETAKKVIDRVEELSIFDFKVYEEHDLRKYTITELALDVILREYGENK